MAEQLLDVHYTAINADGNRLQVTAFGVTPPAVERMNFGTEDKPFWCDLVSVHTAWHDDVDGDTSACFPFDPKYDDCPNDTDGDGDCSLSGRCAQEGCLYGVEEREGFTRKVGLREEFDDDPPT